MGGGQQPDRGDLPDPAAAADHLVPSAPALTDQRLRQPGTDNTCRAQRMILLWNGHYF